MIKETFEFTQNLLMRVDLEMSKGKLCGQAAHAAVSAAEVARKRNFDWWKTWMDEGQRKIVLKVKSLEELLKFKDQADRIGLPAAVVQDRGLTELPPGTITCLGIGPAPTSMIDKLTHGLALL